MHIHILGICGTFMGSLAILAKQLGYQVSGSDQHVYPPMSTQLEQQGIDLREGYDPAHLQDKPDLIVIGNTCSRGNPAVEYILSEALPYCSGPQWLAEHVLNRRWVLAVAGTHGKTTTTSMLSWILEHAGLKPGFLVGGVPKNFDCSAQLGDSDYFVIEADEYDSAFFDKRSKFIHYKPRTLIAGNLEFDHADIFADLQAIQTQFHHLVKIIPQNGLIISPFGNANLQEVFDRGVWSPQQTFSLDKTDDADWHAALLDEDGSSFRLTYAGESAQVEWSLLGQHNVQNALAAVAAAAHAGVSLAQSCAALNEFAGVKRRLEDLGEFGGVRVYDDFAHHPTAIKTTLDGKRAAMGESGDKQRLIAVIEARSNTMKMGYHQQTLAASLAAADIVYWYKSAATQLDLDAIAASAETDFHSVGSVDELISRLVSDKHQGDHIVIMSNGGFEGLHQRLCEALSG
ncbi:MAG: UDP-N-acetylmuramate:L-alanyl-gamma-D-glutamyl-meso-diaminopimelate ligase [Gammaproteobacteria bacterium]|nr:UDP-N-acetylmuramate:L-alanyl-gamma-D-glutamyl-meso-diaminopimelate ligase [Gammaproteobacteria bacterium]MAY03395.1 UDP-N-acetylmuramate:L-alanyl-gamma-D-glutamyl-meso-diaminopimelate ligase [Gammaproteobacteria bacterium]|tara:strand:+ start:225 stop:1598 length:1374 start_codon:yes stop_codon:yes gene_type:complete